MTIKEIIELMKHYLRELLANDTLGKSIASILVIFLGSNRMLAFLIIILVIIDFITGVIKSKKLGVKIESNKFRNTVLKIYVYYSLIITLGIVDYMVGVNVFIRVGYAFIGITEGKSIIENLIVIYPDLEKIKEQLKWWKNNGNSSKTLQS
jgi:phage-related holin